MTHGNASACGRFWREQIRKPEVLVARIVWSMYWLVYSSLARTAASWAIPRSWASSASTLSRLPVVLPSATVQNHVGPAGARRSVQA